MSWDIWAGPMRPTVEPLPQRVHRGSHPWPASERQTAVAISRWETPDFTERPLCAESDPEIFYPEKGNSAGPAKEICKRCKARDECLAWALSRDEKWGVWGGTTVDERQALKRRAS